VQSFTEFCVLLFHQQDLFAQQQLWTTSGEVFLTEQLSLTRPQKLTKVPPKFKIRLH